MPWFRLARPFHTNLFQDINNGLPVPALLRYLAGNDISQSQYRGMVSSFRSHGWEVVVENNMVRFTENYRIAGITARSINIERDTNIRVNIERNSRGNITGESIARAAASVVQQVSQEGTIPTTGTLVPEPTEPITMPDLATMATYVRRVMRESSAVTTITAEQRQPAPPLPSSDELEFFPEFIDSSITFGCEFEFISTIPKQEVCNRMIQAGMPTQNISSCHSDDHSVWNIQHDGSIRRTRTHRHAMEIATPILRGVTGLMQIKKFLTLIAPFAKVNQSCGGHVHFGNLGTSPVGPNIFELLKDNESFLDQFTASRRRGRGGRFARTVIDQAYDNNRANKYYKYSFRNYSSNGTFENRHLEGTLDFKRIATWICVNQAIVRKARVKNFKASSRFNFLAELFGDSQSVNADKFVATFNANCKAR